MAPKQKKEKKLSKKAQERKDKMEAEQKKKQQLDGEGTVKRLQVLDSAVITGNLASRPDSKDLKIDQFSVLNHGKPLVQDTMLELNYGRRYGLIGQNGSGKSTILQAIAQKEVCEDFPESIDMWFLDKEQEPSDLTQLEAVIEKQKNEYERLEKLTITLMEENEGQGQEENQEQIDQISEKLDKMDPHMFEQKQCELLYGLGFQKQMMGKMTKDMSGGWRMRVQLQQALFVQPTLLLLDEPTNHLDLGQCVWLENYLQSYPSTLVMVSHSQDFMNTVCTNILQLTHDGKLQTWGGNYDQYVRTRQEREKNQMTKWKKEQDDINHLLDFIRSCGTYQNLRKQAESKQKVIDKMKEQGLTEKPVEDPVYQFSFPDSEKLPPPVLSFNDVSFSYSGKKEDHLYENLELGVDCDSRIQLVGPNGQGKSTLLKLMRNEIFPTEGEVKRNGHLRIGQYNQHSEEVLDLELNPLQFFEKMYPAGIITKDGPKKMNTEEWRQHLGKFGVTGDKQTRKMETMSDGFRTRVVFQMIQLTNPHILLLDEPTNHLDMQCIDQLGDQINKFEGGLVLVSHDFRLIGQVQKEIWVCDNKTIKPWKGDIQSYKKHLANSVLNKKALMSQN